MHQGSCLCGAIRYEITAPIKRITHCHCSMCRKAHGAAFGSYVTVAHGAFRFTEGQDMVAAYSSSPGVTRTFCKRCGSTLQWYSTIHHPETVSIAAGTLDTSPPPPPQQHIYAAFKASWYRIEDAIPQAEAGL
ncbi:MAG TPA: GFA family protein [Noviherbaspirillum sp.]|nr:GFA family protein [Noviherbaspirillum sp.]